MCIGDSRVPGPEKNRTPAEKEQAIATVSDGTRTLNYTVDETFGLSPGNLTQVVDARGQSTSFTYTDPYPASDPFARFSRGPDPSYQLSRVRPEGNTPYTQTWDSDGRVATQTSARGATTSFAYAGATTTLTDPLGNTVTDTHDADGDLTGQVDATAQTSTLAYDAAGRRQSLTDREGDATAYTYDASSGKVTSITRADGTVVAYTYQQITHALGYVLDDLSRIDYPEPKAATAADETELDSALEVADETDARAAVKDGSHV